MKTKSKAKKAEAPKCIGVLVECAKPETVESVLSAILSIMDTRADQETIRHALTMFKDGVRPGDTSISYNTFSAGVAGKEGEE